MFEIEKKGVRKRTNKKREEMCVNENKIEKREKTGNKNKEKKKNTPKNGHQKRKVRSTRLRIITSKMNERMNKRQGRQVWGGQEK